MERQKIQGRYIKIHKNQAKEYHLAVQEKALTFKAVKLVASSVLTLDSVLVSTNALEMEKQVLPLSTQDALEEHKDDNTWENMANKDTLEDLDWDVLLQCAILDLVLPGEDKIAFLDRSLTTSAPWDQILIGDKGSDVISVLVITLERV